MPPEVQAAFIAQSIPKTQKAGCAFRRRTADKENIQNNRFIEI